MGYVKRGTEANLSLTQMEAAVARRDRDFAIIARTNVVHGLDEALRRGKACRRASMPWEAGRPHRMVRPLSREVLQGGHWRPVRE